MNVIKKIDDNIGMSKNMNQAGYPMNNRPQPVPEYGGYV